MLFKVNTQESGRAVKQPVAIDPRLFKKENHSVRDVLQKNLFIQLGK